MSRAQQGQTFNTAQGENATDEANTQKSQAAEQTDINNEQSQLAKFAANNPYVQGGQFQTAQNQTIADSANASANAAKAGAQTQALRTGQNPAAANAAAITAAQNAERTASGEQGNATTERIGEESKYNQQGLTDANAITQQQENLASLQSGAAQGALGTQEQAAQTPSFLDELGSGLINGADDFAGGAGMALCPAEGSMILLPDGREVFIEDLSIGDLIKGIDGTAQRIEHINVAFVRVMRVKVNGMRETRVSRSHAFALEGGGFVEARNSRGKVIQTKHGPRGVLLAAPDGHARVFDLITDGSHTYRADGVWAIGNGQPDMQAEQNIEELTRA